MELITTTAIIVFIFIGIMLLTKRPLSEPDGLTGSKWQYSNWLFYGASAVMLYVACFRNGFVDTGTYKHIYTMVGSDWENVDIPGLDHMERPFLMFMVLLNHISPDPNFFVFVTSLITIGINLYTIKKYAYNLPFSLFLFFTTSYMGQLNGIRQVMAAAILQLSIIWLIERKPVPYIILVLLLSNFHASILIMIPLYFVICGRRMNWGILLFILAIGACFLAPNVANRIMGELLEDSVYLEYLDNEMKMGGMRLLVAACPLVFTVLFRFMTPEEEGTNHRLLDILINAHIVNVGFTALGMRMVYFARISMYISYAMPLLLPRTIEECFDDWSKRIVTIIATAAYLFFFLYQCNVYNSQGYFHDFYLIF